MTWKKEGKSWLSKGYWSVMDQGLFSGSNFILNILLARWLPPREYGAFVLVYTIFWLLGIFHISFLTEPMLVFGSGKFKNQLTAYLRFLYTNHWRFSLVLGVLFLLVGHILQQFNFNSLATGFWSLIVTGPLLLLQQLLRKLCYVRQMPKLAPLSGGVYLTCVCLGAFSLVWYEQLSILSIFTLMGTASLASCLLLAFVFRAQPSSDTGKMLGTEPLKHHLRYGKWAVGNGFLGAIPDEMFRLLLPIWSGLEATGVFRALTIVLVIPGQILTALGIMLIPFFVKIREKPNYPLTLFLIGGLFLTLSLGYWVGLGVFGPSILNLLYQGKFSEYAPYLWVIGLVPVFQSMASILGLGILARENPKLIFRSRLWATGLTTLPGIGLMAMYGIGGACLGMLIGFIASFVTLVYFYQKENSLRN